MLIYSCFFRKGFPPQIFTCYIFINNPRTPNLLQLYTVVRIEILYSPAGEVLLNAYFGHGTGQIMLDDVQCAGSENKLLACSSAPLLKVSSNCDHFDDAGVRCEGIHIDCHEQYNRLCSQQCFPEVILSLCLYRHLICSCSIAI